MNITVNITDARYEYAQLGLDTIPLCPGSIEPIDPSWQTLSQDEMWSSTPANANIGLLCGRTQNLAVITSNDKLMPGTSTRVRLSFDGLGLPAGSFPLVSTVSGNCFHFYVSLSDPPSGYGFQLLHQIGAGEMLFGPNAYVVAPPSFVDEKYRLVSGDFSIIPEFDFKDLESIVSGAPVTPRLPSKRTISVTDISVLPRTAQELLNGHYHSKYTDPSHAEMALITILINQGADRETVVDLFEAYPCAGYYCKLRNHSPSAAKAWLLGSFCNAAVYATGQESEGRRRARIAMALAEEIDWSGRSGASEKLVYLAHASIAFDSGQLIYHASCRVLTEVAGLGSKNTASPTNKRLINRGLIRLVRRNPGGKADEYQLIIPKGMDPCKLGTLLPSMRECTKFVNHDVFRRDGFGKSGAKIYYCLRIHGPLTEKEISTRSSTGIRTVRKRLKQMSSVVDDRTGEVLALVECVGGKWRALKADLDRVAKLLGTSGIGERQHDRHVREREIYRSRFGN